jgi:dTDP-4-dehydrorhamnose 3,5-epimerase
MKRVETSLPGVCILEPRVFRDPRGFFLESYHAERFAALGITSVFVQDNHSESACGTLRGLHYQQEHPQAKLCRVVRGEVLDVSVDIRAGSPTFGRWVGVRLSAENQRLVFIPRGFAHGFLVLTERAEFLYKCDDFYDPHDERGIRWNDPRIGIEWGIAAPLLSARDANSPLLDEIPDAHLPRYEPPVPT